MRRIIVALMMALIVTALTGGAVLAAPKIVNPNTLTPTPPPDTHPVCKQTGHYVICHTWTDERIDEPEFKLSCGTGVRTVYLTSLAHRKGIRWYSDGLLVRRFVTEHEEGSLSLSPTGEEPTVRVFDHNTWVDNYTTPGDEDSAITTFHGNGFRIVLPGGGDLLHIAGFDQEPDGPFHGIARDLNVDEDTGFVSDPEVNAALCAALGDPIPE